jgi:hypothetical protein
MNLLDLLKNLSKTYNSLVDKAKIPEAVWKPQEDLPAEDKNYVVRDNTGVIVGSLDGVANELTDKAQLVGLGLQVVSDPTKTATDLLSSQVKVIVYLVFTWATISSTAFLRVSALV